MPDNQTSLSLSATSQDFSIRWMNISSSTARSVPVWHSDPGDKGLYGLGRLDAREYGRLATRMFTDDAMWGRCVGGHCV